MSLTIFVSIPTLGIRRHSASLERGVCLGELLARVEERYPALEGALRAREGGSLPDVHVYINGRAIERGRVLRMPLHEDDEVALVPSLAGGGFGFSEEQIKRYSRQLILPEVGGKGQKKLLAARALVVGAGGLGSPVLAYLSAAGVGTIGIIDFDRVDRSNLQRQIIYRDEQVDRAKVLSAADFVHALNPDVVVETHAGALDASNAMELVGKYGVIVDGTDNFAARYVLNDACVLAGKPNVHGSVYRFDGQATVFLPGRGCYRCLYPVPPPPGLLPSCQEAGVLGVVPGVIGMIQATETLKLILGAGETLAGRLALYDALAMELRLVRIGRDPRCPVCGDDPSIIRVEDVAYACDEQGAQ